MVAYSGVKSIYLAEEGLTFQTDGNKLFVLAEPPSYSQKGQEPFRRSAKEQIPLRFSELEHPDHAHPDKGHGEQAALMTYGSFTVLKPSGINCLVPLLQHARMSSTPSRSSLPRSLNKQAGVPKSDAVKASQLVVEGLKNFTIWNK